MAWEGYWTLDGNEIINAARTEAYCASHGWFRAAYDTAALGPMLGESYNSPLQDDAPWTDPHDLDSYDFLGIYPLEITGADDSTATTSVTESLSDGGVLGRTRYSTRAVVFSVALLGRSEAAVSAGMRWLKTVLGGNQCSAESCGNSTLCFLDAPPCLDFSQPCDPAECLTTIRRSLYRVAPVSAPVVTAKTGLTDGCVAWTATFTLTCGNPFVFGDPLPLLAGFMDPTVDDPYVDGLPDGATFDEDGYNDSDTPCVPDTYQPLVDPNCPQIISPPAVPSINLVCFTFPENFRRRSFTIPAQVVPVWSTVVPVIAVHTSDVVRNVRVRMFAQDGLGGADLEGCKFCVDVVFSYIPANATLTFDAADRTVYVDTDDARRRADGLVYDSNGSPFEWPELTCGFGYTVTVDTPINGSVPSLDLSLLTKTA